MAAMATSIGCGGQLPVFGGATNHAILEGAELGRGTAMGQLRKTLRVNRRDSGSWYVDGNAFVLRDGDDIDLCEIAIPITNRDSAPHCFIRATMLTFRDATGARLDGVTAPTSLNGSVALVGTNSDTPEYVDTCLASGETGYLLGLWRASDSSLFDSVTSVDLMMANSRGWTPHEPPVQLVPRSYSPTADGGLRVTLEHTGTGTASITPTFSKYVLLDQAGDAVWWGYTVDNAQPAAVSKGTATLDEKLVLYEGRANRMHVFIDYRLPGSSPSMSGPDVDGSTAEQMLSSSERRQDRIDALEARLGDEP